MTDKLWRRLWPALVAVVLVCPARADDPPFSPEAPKPGAAPQAAAPQRHARVSLLEGELLVRGKDEEEYSYVRKNAVLRDRDSLWTEERSFAEVELERDSFLRLGAETRVELRSLPPESDVRLWKGSIYVDLSGRLDRGLLVKTPAGDIDIDPDTVVRIDIGKADSTTISVFEGRVTAFPDRGDRVRVAKGRRLFVDPGEAADFPRAIARDEEQDSLDSFQVRREEFYAERPVPEQLKEPLVGARELNDYGNWVVIEQVVYWQPVVAADWRPYTYGNWNFLADCGWTWFPLEPWGYTTCHYGRWDWQPGFGWLWCPGYAWSPAWVSWGTCGDYVTWCALDRFDRPCAMNSHFVSGGLRIDFGCWNSVHRRDWHTGGYRVRPLSAQRDAAASRFAVTRQIDTAVGRPGRLLRGSDRGPDGGAAAERARDLEGRVRPPRFRENTLAERVRGGRAGAGEPAPGGAAGIPGGRPRVDPFARDDARERAAGRGLPGAGSGLPTHAGGGLPRDAGSGAPGIGTNPNGARRTPGLGTNDRRHGLPQGNDLGQPHPRSRVRGSQEEQGGARSGGLLGGDPRRGGVDDPATRGRGRSGLPDGGSTADPGRTRGAVGGAADDPIGPRRGTPPPDLYRRVLPGTGSLGPGADPRLGGPTGAQWTGGAGTSHGLDRLSGSGRGGPLPDRTGGSGSGHGLGNGGVGGRSSVTPASDPRLNDPRLNDPRLNGSLGGSVLGGSGTRRGR